jgi:hypothetical protein
MDPREEAMSERMCRHEPCHCQPAPGSAWCSDVCHSATARSRPTDEDCACGHPECRPENVTEDTPAPVA